MKTKHYVMHMVQCTRSMGQVKQNAEPKSSMFCALSQNDPHYVENGCKLYEANYARNSNITLFFSRPSGSGVIGEYFACSGATTQ